MRIRYEDDSLRAKNQVKRKKAEYYSEWLSHINGMIICHRTEDNIKVLVNERAVIG